MKPARAAAVRSGTNAEDVCLRLAADCEDSKHPSLLFQPPFRRIYVLLRLQLPTEGISGWFHRWIVVNHEANGEPLLGHGPLEHFVRPRD